VAGVPLSQLHRRDDEAGPADGMPGRRDGVLFSLEPDNRAWLHARIAQRFDAMLAAGLLDEVRRLRTRRPALHADLPSMRCVGYRQAWEALEAAQARGSDTLSAAELAALRERGIAATRQLAKRQVTWLRSMPWRVAIAADAADVEARLLRAVERAIGPPGTAP
jgi:tRNA dimethylallyltransferase